MQFGAGYAACPGQNLARVELAKICATLFRDYDIRQVDPKQHCNWEGPIHDHAAFMACVRPEAARPAKVI